MPFLTSEGHRDSWHSSFLCVLGGALVRQQHNRSSRKDQGAGHAVDAARRQRRGRPRHSAGIQKDEPTCLRETNFNSLIDIAPDVNGIDKASVDDRLDSNAAAVKPLTLNAAADAEGRADRNARGLRQVDAGRRQRAMSRRRHRRWDFFLLGRRTSCAGAAVRDGGERRSFFLIVSRRRAVQLFVVLEDDAALKPGGGGIAGPHNGGGGVAAEDAVGDDQQGRGPVDTNKITGSRPLIVQELHILKIALSSGLHAQRRGGVRILAEDDAAGIQTARQYGKGGDIPPVLANGHIVQIEDGAGILDVEGIAIGWAGDGVTVAVDGELAGRKIQKGQVILYVAAAEGAVGGQVEGFYGRI